MDDPGNQQATIDFLSRPESHGFDGPVECVETHGAIVFLAGDRAFKLKRAVDLGYLDFSTPEKRHAACEAELALNRRTAPDLYLAVRSIGRGADGSLGFDAGDPVDWVVEMQRFPGDALLSEVAARGELTPALVRELADAIAAFHEIAKPVRRDGAARMARVIDTNRAAMAAAEMDAAACDEWERKARAALRTVADLLDARAAQGHVRHCHGDLHLRNICLWNGHPTLFDCLEFNADLATTDVLYDVAFLVMDLLHRGFRDEASLLLNRYLDMRAEGGGMAALPLFLSVRSAVRAHVTAQAALQHGEDNEDARAYLRQAIDWLSPQPPLLVAVGGLSGTGKSTLAGALAPDLGAAPGARWLRSDELRKRRAGVKPEQALPASAYTPEENAAVYAALIDEAAAMLAAGRAVIVDGVFAREDERTRIERVAGDAGVPFIGLWLEAPREALLARVGDRRGDASDAGPAVVERQLGYALGDLSGWHRVDASGAPGDTLAAARAVITR
ncbi:AAA family ATPase [Novosphingobium sp. ZN18A2]|uniref:bifunctional aminoglycoside phosphotransferase/ATP-binding protein n=1 Tax=Novosphingobium sp. ZN18A2 TaxID=3079861 RepID=UPI0030D5998F